MNNPDHKSRFSWSQEATCMLIELYKKYPVLYNSTHSDYKNQVRRLNALKGIRNEMVRRGKKITVEEIKKKIHGLRTQYTHHLAKMKKNEDARPTLWCFTQLDFIGNSQSSEVQSGPDDDGTNINDSKDLGNFTIYEQNDESQDESFYDYNMVKQEDTPSTSTSEATIFTPVSTHNVSENERNGDCVATFAKLVELELRKITNPQALRKVKKEIINVLMDAQEACDN